MKTLRRAFVHTVIAIVAAAAPSVATAQPAPIDMHGCVEHTTFNGGPDYPNDYRCAGVALDFHLAGVARSPYPMWAGQWLFTDGDGRAHVGWCTFNRGIHPTAAAPSLPVLQTFPNDPGGSKSAYLTWRYGDVLDDLAAAGLWAVFHFYAQDAAGSNRATVASMPLVPSLDVIAEASGRQDIEDVAIALDAEAQRFAEPFVLSVELADDGSGQARLMSGSTPVAGHEVELVVSGAAFDDDASTVLLHTGADGIAIFEVVGPPQDVTVTASATAPGSAQVYRGAAVDPVGHLPQLLVTAGQPRMLVASAVITLATPEPTTTSTTEVPTTTTISATTTDAPTTTTDAPTTTIDAPTTTISTTTTDAPTPTSTTDITTTTSTTTTDAPSTSAFVAPSVPDVVSPGLPKTGGTSPGIAYVGTALLVAGLGVRGAVRRQRVADP